MPLRVYGPLFAQVYGDGSHPQVVALHGWGRRGSDFDRVLDGLDAIAVDLPGFGATAPPGAAMGAEGYADQVIEVLASFDGPTILVGHSFGGRVATCVAARRPDLVSRLVLTGVPLLRRTGGKGPSISYRVVRWAHRAGLVSDQRMERIRRTRGSADYQAASGVMRDVLVAVVNESYEDQLRAVRCPVVLVWGAEDRETGVAIGRAAREILEAAGTEVTLQVVPGVGHHTPLEAPGVLRAAIGVQP